MHLFYSLLSRNLGVLVSAYAIFIALILLSPYFHWSLYLISLVPIPFIYLSYTFCPAIGLDEESKPLTIQKGLRIENLNTDSSKTFEFLEKYSNQYEFFPHGPQEFSYFKIKKSKNNEWVAYAEGSSLKFDLKSLSYGYIKNVFNSLVEKRGPDTSI